MSYADYQIEEYDDPRTWLNQPYQLVPDCEIFVSEPIDIAMDLSEDTDSSDRSSATDEFWDKFEHLVYACGKTAYYWRMLENLKNRKTRQAP